MRRRPFCAFPDRVTGYFLSGPHTLCFLHIFSQKHNVWNDSINGLVAPLHILSGIEIRTYSKSLDVIIQLVFVLTDLHEEQLLYLHIELAKTQGGAAYLPQPGSNVMAAGGAMGNGFGGMIEDGGFNGGY